MRNLIIILFAVVTLISCHKDVPENPTYQIGVQFFDTEKNLPIPGVEIIIYKQDGLNAFGYTSIADLITDKSGMAKYSYKNSEALDKYYINIIYLFDNYRYFYKLDSFRLFSKNPHNFIVCNSKQNIDLVFNGAHNGKVSFKFDRPFTDKDSCYVQFEDMTKIYEGNLAGETELSYILSAGHRGCNVSFHKADYLAKKDNVGKVDYVMELKGLPEVNTYFIKR